MNRQIGSKSSLAVVLSRITVFSRAKVRLEQYPTDSEIAAEVLWSAFLKGDIENKVIVDLGAGTGILGLGAMLLGAKKVYFIDIDPEALEIAQNTISHMKSEGFLEEDIKEGKDFDIKVMDIKELNEKRGEGSNIKGDLVIQNPPFGTREKHIDRLFLQKALLIAPIIYSFHKTSTEKFMKAFTAEERVRITEIFRFAFPLKKSLAHHKKKIQRIAVSCYRLEKAV